jgi:hypothetical protein
MMSVESLLLQVFHRHAPIARPVGWFNPPNQKKKEEKKEKKKRLHSSTKWL